MVCVTDISILCFKKMRKRTEEFHSQKKTLTDTDFKTDVRGHLYRLLYVTYNAHDLQRREGNDTGFLTHDWTQAALRWRLYLYNESLYISVILNGMAH